MFTIRSIYVILHFQLEKVIQISLKFKHKLEFLVNSSVQIPFKLLKHKLEFLINSTIVQSLQLKQNFLEIQPFSEAATRGVPYKKLFLKILCEEKLQLAASEFSKIIF